MCVLACAGPSGGGIAGPIDAARGERYFKAKCNACHPGGGKGAGPALLGKALPGPLKKNEAGIGHNVPAVEYESLLAYLTVITHPPAAEPAAPAPPPAPAPDSGT
jgi:mono/diheme cytochrome c family protein